MYNIIYKMFTAHQELIKDKSVEQLILLYVLDIEVLILHGFTKMKKKLENLSIIFSKKE